MRRIRVIPVLLLQNGGLVKSVKFKNHTYVGDPLNAVKIFNEKEVDELVVLDISATSEKRGPDIQFIKEIASEAFMPLGYGGGVSTMGQIKALVQAGVEKVILNTGAVKVPGLIKEAAAYVGSQSIVVSMDVRKNIWGKYSVFIENGTKNIHVDPIAYAKKMEADGAGEIMLMSIDRDGTFKGFDNELINLVSSAVNIPVIAAGGASTVEDFAKAVESGASAVSAGSLFVFQGSHRAVLISYPNQDVLKEKLFSHFI